MILYMQLNDSSLTEEEMRKRVATGDLQEHFSPRSRSRRQVQVLDWPNLSFTMSLPHSPTNKQHDTLVSLTLFIVDMMSYNISYNVILCVPLLISIVLSLLSLPIFPSSSVFSYFSFLCRFLLVCPYFLFPRNGTHLQMDKTQEKVDSEIWSLLSSFSSSRSHQPPTSLPTSNNNVSDGGSLSPSSFHGPPGQSSASHQSHQKQPKVKLRSASRTFPPVGAPGHSPRRSMNEVFCFLPA